MRHEVTLNKLTCIFILIWGSCITVTVENVETLSTFPVVSCIGTDDEKADFY
jgi:hypothetical protein